jgi:hypothetical protein
MSAYCRSIHIQLLNSGGFPGEVVDIKESPLTINILCALSITVMPKVISNLGH